MLVSLNGNSKLSGVRFCCFHGEKRGTCTKTARISR